MWTNLVNKPHCPRRNLGHYRPRALQQFYSAPIILSKSMERRDDAEAQQTESSLPNAALKLFPHQVLPACLDVLSLYVHRACKQP